MNPLSVKATLATPAFDNTMELDGIRPLAVSSV
jgi:hypothetical protein